MKGYIKLSDLEGRELGGITLDDEGNLGVEAETEEARVFLENITREISGKRIRLPLVRKGDRDRGEREIFYEKTVEKGDEEYLDAVLFELSNYDVRIKEIRR